MQSSFNGQTKYRQTIFTWPIISAIVIAVVGISFMVLVLFSPAFNGENIVDAQNANDYGGLVSGVCGSAFSLAGFFLLFETIRVQRQTFRKQQFDAKFFELVRYHRENVSQMQHRLPNEINETAYKNAVFIHMRHQFLDIYKFLLAHFPNKETEKKTVPNLRVVNAAYLVLFFGLSKDHRKDLDARLSQFCLYDAKMKTAIDELAEKKAAYGTKVYYGGHQVRLAHYFRHLYQTTIRVDSETSLNTDEKEDFMRLLRSQLTQHELAIFFLNSLSLGADWDKNNFLKKYNLLKNLPENFLDGIRAKDFYPNFTYDYEK